MPLPLEKQPPPKEPVRKEPVRHVVKPLKPSADLKPNRTKPVTISLNTAKNSAQNIMNEFTMVVAEETPAQLKLLFTPKVGRVKLSSILRYAERIKSSIGPNVTFAGPFSEGDVGGLQVNISRVISIAARVSASVKGSAMIFESIYRGVYNTLVDAAISSDSLVDVENSVYRSMSVNLIECSIAEQSVLRIGGGANLIEHLTAIAVDWKNPKTVHYAHSTKPILLTTKSGKISVAKGDPFSYRYDSTKNILFVALPAHGVVKESEIVVTPALQDWILRSDPKSKMLFELPISKEKSL